MAVSVCNKSCFMCDGVSHERESTTGRLQRERPRLFLTATPVPSHQTRHANFLALQPRQHLHRPIPPSTPPVRISSSQWTPSLHSSGARPTCSPPYPPSCRRRRGAAARRLRRPGPRGSVAGAASAVPDRVDGAVAIVIAAVAAKDVGRAGDDVERVPGPRDQGRRDAGDALPRGPGRRGRRAAAPRRRRRDGRVGRRAGRSCAA